MAVKVIHPNIHSFIGSGSKHVLSANDVVGTGAWECIGKQKNDISAFLNLTVWWQEGERRSISQVTAAIGTAPVIGQEGRIWRKDRQGYETAAQMGRCNGLLPLSQVPKDD